MDIYSDLVFREENPMGENTLVSGGEMGQLIRKHDWAASPLGTVSQWPQSLRTAVSICLSSRFPTILFWGQELRQFYNDAYRPILGMSKHPQVLGQRAEDCWQETWNTLGPILNGILLTGETTWSEDILLPVERNGFIEECYFTCSYSPIHAEAGRVGGIFCTLSETTAKVLSQRRLLTLQSLTTLTNQAGSVEEVCKRYTATLAAYEADVPMALIYLLASNEDSATLAGVSGIAPGTLASPERVSLSDPAAAWPFIQVIQTGEKQLVQNMYSRFGGISGPLHQEGPDQRLLPQSALVLPISRPAVTRPYGFLVVGVSPRRPLDHDYHAFLTLVAGQIASAITTTLAYQDAHRHDVTRAQLAGLASELDEQGQIVSVLAISRGVTELVASQQRTQEALNTLLTVAEVLVAHNFDDNEQSELVRRSTTQYLLDSIRRVLACAGAAMVVLESGTEVIDSLVTTGLGAAYESSVQALVQGQPLAGRFSDQQIIKRLRAGEIVSLDVSQPGYRERQPDPSFSLALLVPMRLQHELVGIITLYPKDIRHQYTAEDFTLIEAIGKLSALLIERERLQDAREEAWTNALAAREVTQQMDEFIGIVSHELKTPLTTVKGNLQLAKRQLARLHRLEAPLTGELSNVIMTLQGLVNRAEQQIGVQNRLVNDLIDVSRIRVDRLELQITECDLARIIRDAIEDQRNLLPSRTIYFNTSALKLLVRADAQRVGQVINNYLSNALKYSDARSPIEAQIIKIGQVAQVSVRDEGQGLSKEQQQHIWERFYRSPGIEVKSGSGTGLGLGLHICRTLIERQGGQVGVISTPGEGSTFWFTLPLVDS